MSSVASRTRSRRFVIERSDSDVRSRPQRPAAIAPPRPPPKKKPVIVIDDDDEEEVGIVEARDRSQSRSRSPRQRRRDSPMFFDGSERERSGEFREPSVSESNESSDSSVEILGEEMEEETSSSSAGDDEDAEASKDCSFSEKSSCQGSPEADVNVKEEEEAEEEVPGIGDEHHMKPSSSSFHPFCVARRTRLQVGKQNRVVYTKYFNWEKGEEEEEEKRKEEDVEEVGDEEDESDDNAEPDKSVSAGTTESEVEKGEVLVKKRRFGIEILVSVGHEEATKRAGGTGVAQRTRSRFDSVGDVEMKKMGTMSNPYPLDADEKFGTKPNVDFDTRNGEGKDFCEEHEVDNGIRRSADKREKAGTEGGRAHKYKKRKRVQPPKATELFKILADTIWDDDKTLPDEPVNGDSPEESPSNENMLPLVFSFEDDGAKPVEKSDHEKELDELWADFDFAMGADNIGVYNGDEVQAEETSGPDVGSDPSVFCSKGKHQCILDEEIGIRCKFCSFVDLEIKHIFPSWESRCGERITRTNNANAEVPLFINDLFANRKDDGCQGYSGYSTGTVWDLIPGIKDTMFQHQQEAFEFMWRDLAGSTRLDELKSCVGHDGTGGCVISHAPGTGKTRLAIVFIQSYMKVFPECRPVIVAPRGLIQTWKNEFRKWGVHIFIHNLNEAGYSGQEDGMALDLVSKSNNQDARLMRLVKLYSWDKGNSVLLISYSLFTTIYFDNGSRGSQLKNILIEKPGLIIFDEGHTPRNERSRIWSALENIRTSKRIILSGTPFQNNFTELYNTLCLVRPKFAEKISTRTSKLGQTKRAELFASKNETLPGRRDAKSKWNCLTKCVNADGKELEEVKSIIRPFVHVHSGKVLDKLPGLRKCIIVLNPLPQQKNIIDKTIAMRSNNYLDKDYRNSLLSIHPSLAMVFLTDEEKCLIDKMSEEKNCSGTDSILEKLRINPNAGVKTKFVADMIRLCEALKERVLVFCQYIEPLEMIRDQLVNLFGWTDGREVLKMDGHVPSKNRQSLIDNFNDLSSGARVLLASTKACSEGISLVGASRVILIDILWNPSMEHQAISRAYRIGQGKFVYIYQLITFGMGESSKYGVQATKDKMSKLVFSPGIDLNSMEANSSHATEELTYKLVAEDKILEEMTRHESLKDFFRKIYYPPKASNNPCVFHEEDSNPANDHHC